MAVEKSYVRLGFFLVVALRRHPRHDVLFVQRLRSREVIRDGHLHDRERERPGHLQPGSVQGRDPGPCRGYAGRPARQNIIRVDFEVFIDRLNTVGTNVKQIQELADLGGTFPRLRAQVVGTRSLARRICCSTFRRILHHRSSWASPQPDPTCRRCPRRWRRSRIACRPFWSAPKTPFGRSARSCRESPTASIGAIDSSPTSSESFRTASCLR